MEAKLGLEKTSRNHNNTKYQEAAAFSSKENAQHTLKYMPQSPQALIHVLVPQTENQDMHTEPDKPQNDD